MLGQINLQWFLRGLEALVTVTYRASVAQSCPTLCDPVDRVLHTPLSLESSRREHWSGCRAFLQPGIEPGAPTFRAVSLPSEPPGKPSIYITGDQIRSDDSYPHSPSNARTCQDTLIRPESEPPEISLWPQGQYLYIPEGQEAHMQSPAPTPSESRQ